MVFIGETVKSSVVFLDKRRNSTFFRHSKMDGWVLRIIDYIDDKGDERYKVEVYDEDHGKLKLDYVYIHPSKNLKNLTIKAVLQKYSTKKTKHFCEVNILSKSGKGISQRSASRHLRKCQDDTHLSYSLSSYNKTQEVLDMVGELPLALHYENYTLEQLFNELIGINIEGGRNIVLSYDNGFFLQIRRKKAKSYRGSDYLIFLVNDESRVESAYWWSGPEGHFKIKEIVANLFYSSFCNSNRFVTLKTKRTNTTKALECVFSYFGSKWREENREWRHRDLIERCWREIQLTFTLDDFGPASLRDFGNYNIVLAWSRLSLYCIRNRFDISHVLTDLFGVNFTGAFLEAVKISIIEGFGWCHVRGALDEYKSYLIDCLTKSCWSINKEVSCFGFTIRDFLYPNDAQFFAGEIDNHFKSYSTPVNSLYVVRNIELFYNHCCYRTIETQCGMYFGDSNTALIHNAERADENIDFGLCFVDCFDEDLIDEKTIPASICEIGTTFNQGLEHKEDKLCYDPFNLVLRHFDESFFPKYILDQLPPFEEVDHVLKAKNLERYLKHVPQSCRPRLKVTRPSARKRSEYAVKCRDYTRFDILYVWWTGNITKFGIEKSSKNVKLRGKRFEKVSQQFCNPSVDQYFEIYTQHAIDHEKYFKGLDLMEVKPQEIYPLTKYRLWGDEKIDGITEMRWCTEEDKAFLLQMLLRFSERADEKQLTQKQLNRNRKTSRKINLFLRS